MVDSNNAIPQPLNPSKGSQRGDDKPLSPEHRKHLQASGISEDVIQDRGYYTETTKPGLSQLGFVRSQWHVPALVMPVSNLDSQIVQNQIRPDQPRTPDGKIAKYELPYKSKVVVDIPARARDGVLDPQTPLLITEGIKKADAAVSRDLCCVALFSVTGWRNQGEFWKRIPLDGRDVFVVFDSDVSTNQSVQHEATELYKLLVTHKANVRFIILPSKGDKKVGLDDYFAASHSSADLLQLATKDLPKLPDNCSKIANSIVYEANTKGIFKVQKSGKKSSRIQLTNFPAKITNEISFDDTLEQSREFIIEATVGGKPVTVTVPAEDYDRMSWVVSQLGGQAVLLPSYGSRESTRAAIQLLSQDICSLRGVRILGWTELDGENVFVHAGGVIHGKKMSEADILLPGLSEVAPGSDVNSGSQEVEESSCQKDRSEDGPPVLGGNSQEAQSPPEDRNEPGPLDEEEHVPEKAEPNRTDLSRCDRNTSVGCGPKTPILPTDHHEDELLVRVPSSLKGYDLSVDTEGHDLAEDIGKVFELLSLTFLKITIPLLAAVFRAILGTADFSIHLYGSSGNAKTELLALIAQFFGAGLDSRHLPASWGSTGNFLTSIAAYAKDVVLPVDDFVPTGSQADIQRANRNAETVFRAQANLAGRGRCNRDGSPREPTPPRCLIISTGEVRPAGHSLNARVLNIEIQPGDILDQSKPQTSAALSKAQENGRKGVYARTTVAFICWVAPQLKAIRGHMRQLADSYRPSFTAFCDHARLVTTAGELMAAFEIFLEFAGRHGIEFPEGVDTAKEEAFTALATVLMHQEQVTREEDPVDRYLKLLASALSTGRAHVEYLSDEEPEGEFGGRELWGYEKIVTNVRVETESGSQADPASGDADGQTDPAAGEDADDKASQEAPTENEPDEQEVSSAAKEGSHCEFQKQTFYRKKGDCVGWKELDRIYLDPEASLEVVQRRAKELGEPQIPFSSRVLGKRLNDRKKLVSKESDRNTKRKTIHGAKKNVFHISAWELFEFPGDGTGLDWNLEDRKERLEAHQENERLREAWQGAQRDIENKANQLFSDEVMDSLDA
jgi:hypothetical protein